MQAETQAASLPRPNLPHQGLSSAEAAERLRRDGPNELPQDQRRRLPRIAWDAVREPMLQLLLAAGVIYLVLGNLAEALILLGFAVLNVLMVVVQETRTESALAALRELASPHALVWRDGQHLRLAAKELVAGDMITIEEGERVPADAICSMLLPCRPMKRCSRGNRCPCANAPALQAKETPPRAAMTPPTSGQEA